MAKVECEVEETDLDNGRGGTTPGVKVTCGECGHCEQSFGTERKSVLRCIMLLKENCPEGKSNFYVADD